MANKDLLLDRLTRFESNCPTSEDLKWALPILQRYCFRSKRQPCPEVIEQEIDFNGYSVLIKQMGYIRLIITKNYVLLESNGVIVASLYNNIYYCIQRINLSKELNSEIIDRYHQVVEEHKSNGGLKKHIETPIRQENKFTLTYMQAKHIKRFIGDSVSVSYVKPSRFSDSLTKIDMSDVLEKTYDKTASKLFWNLQLC